MKTDCNDGTHHLWADRRIYFSEIWALIDSKGLPCWLQLRASWWSCNERTNYRELLYLPKRGWKAESNFNLVNTGGWILVISHVPEILNETFPTAPLSIPKKNIVNFCYNYFSFLLRKFHLLFEIGRRNVKWKMKIAFKTQKVSRNAQTATKQKRKNHTQTRSMVAPSSREYLLDASRVSWSILFLASFFVFV